MGRTQAAALEAIWGGGVRATGAFLGKEAKISLGLEDRVWTPGVGATLGAT